jgi:hypothetical protein
MRSHRASLTATVTTAIVTASLLLSQSNPPPGGTPRVPVTSGSLAENGISVGEAKVFDNRSLVLMLDSLSETLRNLQLIDQEPLKRALGLLQGSRTTDIARNFSATAGGTPKIEDILQDARTVDSVSRSTQKTGLSEVGKISYSLEQFIEDKVNEKLDRKTTTTTSERLPAIPNLPDLIGAVSGAPAFGQSPGDLLSDQVNLTYQIFNLRMALERSLSDRLLPNGQTRLQAVLGFNVSLDPPRDAENSAAVVEVTVSSKDGGPVSLVTLLPLERTYNSVALSTKSNAFGGSAVAKMFTVGYSERRRGQVFYLYRDHDTLSFERMMVGPQTVTFGWQFRPVLGRKSVVPGMRQMLAVIALPDSDTPSRNNSVPLKIDVRTYWRKYDANTLTTSDRYLIGPWPHIGRALSLGLAYPVPNGIQARRTSSSTSLVAVPRTSQYQASLAPSITGLEWHHLDDKTVFLSISGTNFFSGTQVLPANAATTTQVKSNETIDATIPASVLIKGEPILVGRYGSGIPIQHRPVCSSNFRSFHYSEAFGGQHRLTVEFSDPCLFKPMPNGSIPLPIIGVDGEVVTNNPTFLGGNTIEASIPVATLKNAKSVNIVFPFHGSAGRFVIPYYDSYNPYEVSRVVGSKGNTLIYVRRPDLSMASPTVFGPGNRWTVEFEGTSLPVSFAGDQIRFEIPSANPEGNFLLFEPQAVGTPAVVRILAIPAANPKPKPAIEAKTPATLSLSRNDVTTLIFTGSRAADVKTIKINGMTDIKPSFDSTKKELSVPLTREVTGKAAPKITLSFCDAAGKELGTVDIEVKGTPKTKKEKE